MYTNYPTDVLRSSIDSGEDIRRKNNFDLLRLIFASIVVLFHCSDLSFDPAYAWIPKLISATLAVQGFFTMSGFLIIRSYDRDSQLWSYLEKRARRIFPAYWAALVFTLLIGAVFSILPLRSFVGSSSTWKYICSNLLLVNFLNPTLPGLFTSNPVMQSVNGALWTIKVEVAFYLIVPLIVVGCRKWGRWQVLCGIFLLSVFYRNVCDHFHRPKLEIQLPGQLCFFIVGALVYYYYEYFDRHRRWMWFSAIICYVASIVVGGSVLRALGVALGVMCIALLFPSIGQPAKHGDFSYGIYVFHFPIIQLFISLGLVHFHPQIALGVILVCVGAIAFASWKFVEEPCLKRQVRRLKLPERTTASESLPTSDDLASEISSECGHR